MLSGIGDRKELKQFGIRTLVDLPGVGKNLQDRYEVPVSVELKEDLSLLRSCRPTAPQDPCLDSYFSGAWEMLDKEFHGPYSMNGIFGMRIENSGHSKVNAPDLAIVGLPIGYTGIYPGFSTQWAANRWTWLVLKGHSTNSGGYVTLKSADPRDTPEINFRHFWEGNGDWKADMASLVNGVKFARNYLKDASVSGFIAREVTPGDDLQSDAQIEKYIKDETWGHHASCTAKIGSDKDKMAVLDSKFRVRGVKGLRVVDASAFPYIPGFFPVASVFMISEKASDDILHDAYQQG
jgi:choline dehydrogenase